MGNITHKPRRSNAYIFAAFTLFLLYKTRTYWLTPILKLIGIHLSRYASLYRRDKRPMRIILVRHGQSEANLNPHLYDTIPDNQINLSLVGLEQANEAGKKLKTIVKDESVKFFVSPFKRTTQTFETILSHLNQNHVDYFFDPRIREQEWGNLQNQQKLQEIFTQRKKIGRFFFRFETGESGADVYDRASLFLDSIFREMDVYDRHRYENFVIITHGLFMRLFLMRYLKFTVDQFEKLANPDNCEIWILEKNKKGKYDLITPLKEESR